MNKRTLFSLASLVCAACVHAEQPKPQPATGGNGSVIKIDFEALPVGELPDDILVVDGEFKIAESDGNKVLELGYEPLVDGAVLLGSSLKNGGTVKAKIKASSRRRTTPRFGVGIGGTSGYRLRVVPAEDILEISKGDERVTTVEFKWKTDAWFWVELKVLPEGKTWNIEGRAWADGAERPEKAQVTTSVDGSKDDDETKEKLPPTGKASVWGAPFSDKPIQFDDIEITPNAPPEAKATGDAKNTEETATSPTEPK